MADVEKNRNKGKNASKGGALRQLKLQTERQSYFLIFPQLLGFFVFSIYPIYWVMRYSFFRYDGITATFCGMDNFVRAFTRDMLFWKSILNTFIIAYGKLIIEIPLSLLVALALTGSIKKLKKVFMVGFYIPRVTGIAVNCLIFSFIFATYNGTINNFLMSMHIINEPISWLGSKWAAMTVIAAHSLWSGFAVNTLYFMAGISNVSEDVLEAARVDGANSFQCFVKITIPMLAPVIRVILMLAMVNGMKMMQDVLLLTNGAPGGSTNVVMLYIYQLFFNSQGNNSVPEYGYASALGFITTIIIAFTTIIYLKFSKKADSVY